MSFKVQVGPAQIAIHQGRTVLVCEPDGTIPHPSDKGLYFNDTRLISAWGIFADGERWDLLNGGATRHDTASIHLVNRALVTASGPIPARTLGLTLTRSIQGGLHEDIDIAHYGADPVRFNLEIGIRCDFADLFEVKSQKFIRRGSVAIEWTCAATPAPSSEARPPREPGRPGGNRLTAARRDRRDILALTPQMAEQPHHLLRCRQFRGSPPQHASAVHQAHRRGMVLAEV